MSGMFSTCASLTSLTISSFNTKNVKDMSFMFQYFNNSNNNSKDNNEIKNSNNINCCENNNESNQNKDNFYYEDNSNKNNNNNNNNIQCDTYTNNLHNNQQNTPKKEKYHDVNFNRIKEAFNINNDIKENENDLNNTYPVKGQKVYNTNDTNNAINTKSVINNNQNIEQNQRSNRFKQEPVYKEINLNVFNNNNNLNVNYDMNLEQKKQINNVIINNKGNEDDNQLQDNDIQIIEPQKPKKKRPVYKIPPSKKRAVSQGKSLGFIHKYYDENFILEEDNEDNASDSENKKKNLQKMIRQVVNIKKILPKVNNNNDIGEVAVNIEQINQNLRLSHMRFSLESSNNEDNKNNILNSNKKEDNQNIVNSIIIPNTKMENQIEEESINESKIIIDSNLSGPKNSDSFIEQSSQDNININEEINANNKKNQNHNNSNSNSNDKILRNLDLNSSQSMINDTVMTDSFNPSFFDPNETNIKNNGNNSEETLEDKRITLHIADHDLDKYFEKEGINERSSKQIDISTSLRTINLNDEGRDSRMSLLDEQKNNLKNSQSKNVRKSNNKP